MSLIKELVAFEVTKTVCEIGIVCHHLNTDIHQWGNKRIVRKLSLRVTNKIFSSGYFLPAAYLDREDQIGELFRSGQAKVVVVFEEDFEKRLLTEKRAAIRLITDASDANSAQLSPS